jgi:hypothetical protein
MVARSALTTDPPRQETVHLISSAEKARVALTFQICILEVLGSNISQMLEYHFG